jgi:hypothetical protein
MEKGKVDYSTMNIYQKIQLVKEKILKENLKKSGENKYAGFKYYELADFTPSIIKLCNEVGLFTKITFSEELATLKIINVDKSEEFEEYTSPMRNLVLKGCNEIQALGGVETYSRRYLYMSAFDIIENDMFDAKSGEVEESKATPKQIEILEKVYVGETREKLLKANNVEKLEDLSVKKASELIKRLKERSVENGNS